MDFQLAVLPPANTDAQDIPVVQVHGEVDITNAAALRTALAELSAGPLIMDLSDVGYFDSAGFAVLDQLISQGTLAVVVPSGSVVQTAMTMMGLPVHHTTGAARASLHVD